METAEVCFPFISVTTAVTAQRQNSRLRQSHDKHYSILPSLIPGSFLLFLLFRSSLPHFAWAAIGKSNGVSRSFFPEKYRIVGTMITEIFVSLLFRGERRIHGIRLHSSIASQNCEEKLKKNLTRKEYL